ncbi:hypothetical protein O7A70_19650 [Mesorhizobium sp. Cs1299R1N1]|uniref:hypothetical protein n=1 Tax=Mesorhizobium sp. Cs1299R1N1 TaxID=3015172 RepID=UPI00301D621D
MRRFLLVALAGLAFTPAMAENILPIKAEDSRWIEPEGNRFRLASAIRRFNYDCPEAKLGDIVVGTEKTLLIQCGPADGTKRVIEGQLYYLNVAADNYVTRAPAPSSSWWPW